MTDPAPAFSQAFAPPLIQGVAALTQAVSDGATVGSLAQALEATGAGPAAILMDASFLMEMSGRPAEALQLQAEAAAAFPIFRVHRPHGGTPSVRLLALMTPGRLMDNTPLDFITAALGIQLDILFVTEGEPLPAVVPDHDVLFFAAREPAPALRARLAGLFRTWPRPVLNNPALLPRLDRARLSGLLSGLPGVLVPPTAAASRAALLAACGSGTTSRLLPGGRYPVLIRPLDSHAGFGLARLDRADDLVPYLLSRPEGAFHLTAFYDYRSPDGWFRKYRIALIDGAPYLCHMAASAYWMVHYATSGMADSATKRAAEAEAMATFQDVFANRHGGALRGLQARLGFDHYAIDCAETRGGELLVFEADTASIIHRMDARGALAYKDAPMRRAFAAFETMLNRVMCESSAPDCRRSGAIHPPGRKIPA